MTQTYSAQKVTVTWGSLDLTEGAPSTGTFVEITPPGTRRASMTPLLKGGAVINLMNDTTAVVTVTMTKTAFVNKTLSDELNAQVDSGDPSAHALMIKDHSGNDLHSGDDAVLEGWPTVTYAETVPMLVWTFLVPNMRNELHGGNVI